MEREQSLNLRRLRFPDPRLERDFREEYARKSKAAIRAIALVLILYLLVTSAAVLVHRPAVLWHNENGSLFFAGSQFVAYLGIILFSHSRYYIRHAQFVIGLACVFLGVYLGYHVSTPVTNQWGYAQLAVTIMGIYTLSRLRMLAAVAVCSIVMAAYALESALFFHIPLITLSERMEVVLTGNLLGMLAAYTAEQSSRRDFIISHLLSAERQRSEALLLNILPEAIAQKLKVAPDTIADHHPDVTVLFADIVDFTPLSASLPPQTMVELLNEVFSTFDRLAEEYGLEKIKTIGDAYMVAGGLPEPHEDHAGAVASMALAMRDEMSVLSSRTGYPLRLRIGIHSGPVVAGVIGSRKFMYDLWGDTVNLASRMESQGSPDAIQTTEATYQRLKDRFDFTSQGEIMVKGRERTATYRLEGPMIADHPLPCDPAPRCPQSYGSLGHA